ncbi:DUF6286 domain-containing protein [Homoserinimonas sp. OAct 916]|uniref:DUF6286 domain-containing protein n=1 Tax=Homoserinimonas sp. OAct 916 TaxID=2211450 RepID=UPI000DBE8ADF|nr:DUF6286 domain-containing protein [Homoserinimonas sp. OAct 916]
MISNRYHARITRRETHSPRSLLAIILAVILIIVFSWIGTEIVLALLGLRALLVAPVDMFTSAVNVVAEPTGAVAVVGIVVAVVGLILVVAAVSPGRRARHVLVTERAATVVDNEVIASALARHAAYAANVDPDSTTVSVSRRHAVVHLTPTSGVPVDRYEVADVAAKQLESYGLRRPVLARVQIDERGRVGA